MNCLFHLRRTGEKVRATRVIDGEPMCEKCFRGEPIDGKAEHSGELYLQRPASQLPGLHQGPRPRARRGSRLPQTSTRRRTV